MACPDPEVGRGQHHQHGRVTEVVLQEARPTIVRRIRSHDPNRSRGAPDVPRTLPNPGEVVELIPVGHEHEVPRLPVLRRRRESARLENLGEVLFAHRRGRELPHVATRPQGVPRLHAVTL
jgi:hypothetical protein